MPGFACEQIFREMHPFGDLCVICMGCALESTLSPPLERVELATVEAIHQSRYAQVASPCDRQVEENIVSAAVSLVTRHGERPHTPCGRSGAPTSYRGNVVMEV
jgi:hypothetical protein